MITERPSVVTPLGGSGITFFVFGENLFEDLGTSFEGADTDGFVVFDFTVEAALIDCEFTVTMNLGIGEGSCGKTTFTADELCFKCFHVGYSVDDFYRKSTNYFII